MSESKRENKEFTADTTVWYEDGNIVLVAGSTAFRLHKGILASVSPVFGDMFSLAKPDDGSKEGTIDGCPIVRLADSPKDLRWLRLITAGSVELLDGNTLVSFAQLVATVRIAHKYQAERIVQAAGSRLRRFFTPDVIAELHTQGATAKTWRNLWYQKQQECGVEVPMDGATGVEAVNVARLLGCYDDMLPLALLLCCDGDPLQLRNGVRRRDGTVAKLSDSEYLGCVQAIPDLRQTLHRVGVAIMRQCARTAPVQGCGICKKVLVEMMNEYAKEPFSGPLLDGFVWFSWRSEPPNAYASRAKALCNKCILRLIKTFNEIFSDLQLQVNVDKKTGYVQIVVDVTK